MLRLNEIWDQRQSALADSAAEEETNNDLHATYIKHFGSLQRKWIGQFKCS